MAEIIAQFVDGRLVRKERGMELNPTGQELFRGPRIRVVVRRIDQPPAAKRQDKEQCNLTR